MSNLPSNWVICEAAWGEGKRHIYCPDAESLSFHATEQDARDAAADEIRDGGKMVVVMEIKSLFVAKPVEYDDVASRLVGREQ